MTREETLVRENDALRHELDAARRALIDATSRHAGEEVRTRLAAIVESSDDAIISTDLAGIVESWNGGATRLFGYEPREVVGRSVTVLLPSDRVAEEAEILARIARGDSLDHSQTVRQRRDGSHVRVSLSVSPIRDAAGLVVGASKIARDLTAHYRAQEELRASEEHYRALFEHSPLPKWLYDLQSLRILAVNEAALCHYGYTRDEFLSMTILDLRPESDVPDLLNAIPSDLGVAHRGRWRHRTKNGTLIDVEVRAYTFESTARPSRLVVAQDVTDRTRMEAQIRQSQKMDAIGSLAGGIAHDFNNLLSVILSYTMLACESLRPGDPLRDDIEEVRRAGERARDLTRQLLAFSRQQMLEPRAVDLNHIVTGMEKMLRRLLGEDIELSLLPSRTAARVHADPGQVEQVVMNLAVNARDAMPAGGKLTIEISPVDLDAAYADEHLDAKPGPYVLLAVTDTGIGMNAATRERIFDPFFTTKERGKGTGLGLSTVFGIVRQSGGYVGVYSEVGNGTLFKIYLPRTDQEADAVAVVPPAPSSLRGSETILLVEDEEQVRIIVRTILRRQGYNVLEAQNGGEAFLICEKYGARLDLLLTDVVMPRMSGRELADRLRPMRPDMRVLYVSGYTETTVVHHGVLDAGVAFLQKPITPESLLRKVREVLDGSARALR